MTSISDVPSVAATTSATTAANAQLTVSANVALASVVILGANSKRMGLYIYNNSSNTGYIHFGATCNSSNSMTLPIASFATWVMPLPIYTGQISAIRNAGSGTFLINELLA